MFNMNFGKLFSGFNLKSTEIEKKNSDLLLDKNIVIEINNDDASQLIDNTYAVVSQYSAQESLRDQSAIINEYRAMALHPEVDNAIDDIINAMVSCDEEEDPVSIDLSKVEISDATKEKIVDEFRYILDLMKFDATSYEKCRQWYVDGRQVYNVLVDETKPKEGIKGLVMLDSRSVKKIKEIKRVVDPETKIEKIASIDTYFMYDATFSLDNTNIENNKKNGSVQRRSQQLRLTEDSVVFIHSGVVNANNDMILSNLEKARKALNNLRMIEDALVVYRITRAPERRVFYVDVGTLPKKSAEEYMTHVMNKYKSKMVYNSTSGKVEGNAHQISMMEDFWLPRREGGRGTEVDTLQGGANLGDIEDVLYFLRKLYKSLNVPASRLEQDATIALGGRSAEITRDEWKFNKFINRLRRRYNELFTELLKRQLILKNITTPQDWDELFKQNLTFVYASDSFMKEQQDADLLMDQLNTLAVVEPLVGKYFSRDRVKRQVLRWTDEEIIAEKKQIAQEIKDKEYPDPATAALDPESLAATPFGGGPGAFSNDNNSSADAAEDVAPPKNK